MKTHLKITLASLLAFAVTASAITVSDLRSGGYAIFFRHTERDPVLQGNPLAEVDKRDECVAGSELNPTGRRGAEMIRDRFRAEGLPVEKVYVSPTCRTEQMATILFGDAFERTRALIYPAMYRDHQDGIELRGQLRELLRGTPAAGTNRVFISHADVLTPDLVGPGFRFDMGDAAIFHRAGRELRYLGLIRKSDWAPGRGRP